MTKTAFMFLFSLLVFSCALPDVQQADQPKDPGPLFPVYVNGKWGYIDITGKIAIEPQFQEAHPFSEGLARVEDSEGNDAFINKTGKTVIKGDFHISSDFSEGLATIWNDGLLGYIDRKGRLAIRLDKPNVIGIRPFSEGLAAFRIYDGKWQWGFIDKSGNVVIEPTLYAVGDFREGLARAMNPHETPHWGFIDKTGEFVIKPRFHVAGLQFSEGLAAVRLKNDWGYINKKGEIVIEPQFKWAEPFSEGLAFVKVWGDKYGCIDKTGKMVIQPQFAFAEKFCEGLAAVVMDDDPTDWECEGMGFIDKNGQFVIDLLPNELQDFRNGLARVEIWPDEQEEPTYGYIDKTGAWVWKPTK